MASRGAKLLLLCFVFILALTPVAAQDIITYGQTIQGKIDGATPQAFYTFNGNAGDIIAVSVLGISESLQPTVALFGPSGQLAFSNGDIFTAISTDASLSYRIPSTGAYTIIVSGAPGTTGAFVLALQNSTPAVSTALSPDVPTTVNIPLGAPSQVYSFNADPAAPVQVTIDSQTSGFNFTAVVRDANGQIVAVIGSGVSSATFAVPAGTGTYEVVVSSADPATEGTIVLALGGDMSATTTSSPSTPDDSSQPAAAQPPAGVCSVTPANNAVNIRAGNSTAFSVVGSLLPGTYATVNGQNSGWYNISYNGVQGWVADFVVMPNGPCSGLPFVQAPPPPAQPQPQATEEPGQPTATAVPTQPGQTNQPTQTPPPTATTQQAQTAPPDADVHNFVLDRDNGGSFSEAVSYSGGDTSDRVRVTIDNLNQGIGSQTREFQLVLTCFGDGTENLRWGTGGPNSPMGLTCGQSVTIFHTYDSNQTYLNIGFPNGGEGSYVQYQITAVKLGGS